MNKDLTLSFSGNVRKNPGGPGKWAYVISDNESGEVVAELTGIVHANPSCTCNSISWDALIKGVEFLAAARHILQPNILIIQGNSEFVIKQVKGEYRCKSPEYQRYLDAFKSHMKLIDYGDIRVEWIPHHENALAAQALRSL